MGRNTYRYAEVTNFSGGINQQPEGAGPTQVEDARNVWAPKSTLTTRPGYRGVFSPFTALVSATDNNIGYAWFENPEGTFAADSYSFDMTWYLGASGVTLVSLLDVSAAPLHARIYLGFDSIPARLTGLRCTADQAANMNSNATRADVEFWVGDRWYPVPATTVNPTSFAPSTFMSGTDPMGPGGLTTFVLPAGWSQTSVNGVTKYWMRLWVRRTAIDAATKIAVYAIAWGGFGDIVTEYAIDDAYALLGGTQAQFSSGSEWLRVYGRDNNGAKTLVFSWTNRVQEYDSPYALSVDNLDVEPPTFAVIPEFDTAYIAVAGKVIEKKKGVTPVAATVNSLPALVGSGGDYDDTKVAKLTEFPRAKYVRYFKQFLWCAGIEGEPFTVRWSGPGLDGAYNLFPVESFETLSEHDNSPITALQPFHEHMLVFKRDSIWAMVFAGADDLGLPMFSPQLVKTGVGCVSQASLAEINGKLIWLAEDGFYSYDGRQVRKLSGAIDEQCQSINLAKQAQAVGVHWKTQNAYLCSVALQGSTKPNFVFVYDYSKEAYSETGAFIPGAWWFWDDIEAKAWFKGEDQYDLEALYFGDTYGRIYQFAGDSDHGTEIASYVKTHRLNAFGFTTASLAEVRLRAYQDVNDLTVDVFTDDRKAISAAVVDLTDDAEGKWGEAAWGQEWVPRSRRERRISTRETCQEVQFKISATKPMELLAARAGFVPLGRR